MSLRLIFAKNRPWKHDWRNVLHDGWWRLWGSSACDWVLPISHKIVTSWITAPTAAKQTTTAEWRPTHSQSSNSHFSIPTSQGKLRDYHWFNIAYVKEYKKNTIKDLNDVCPLYLSRSTFLQNVLKILWSLHHMVNVDRRRRCHHREHWYKDWFSCRHILMVTLSRWILNYVYLYRFTDQWRNC